MKKLLLAVSVLAMSASAVIAADDPIAVRKALMQAVGAAAGASGAMMKGEMDYNPGVAKLAIAAVNASSHAFGDYFPDGSTSDASTASPKIWEDMAGFKAAAAKFAGDSAAAMQASGKDGPADLDAFKAAMGPVLGNCKTCHEAFRVQK